MRWRHFTIINRNIKNYTQKKSNNYSSINIFIIIKKQMEQKTKQLLSAHYKTLNP